MRAEAARLGRRQRTWFRKSVQRAHQHVGICVGSGLDGRRVAPVAECHQFQGLGAVDWISTVPSQSLDVVKKMPNFQTVTRTSGGHLTIQFAAHIPNSPFKDLRVRKAVAHAIDWKAIITRVLFDQGKPYAEFSPEDFGYDPSIKPYEYDLKRARELLKEAGFANGFEIPCYNLLTPREPNFKEMGEAVFAYLGAVGIRCKIRGL